MSPDFYLFFCVFLIAFLIGFYFFRKLGKFEQFIFSTICGILSAFVSLSILDIGNAKLPKKWSENYKSVKLVSMKDQSSVYGSFYLGGGQISGTLNYSYYYEHGGGFKRGSLNPNNLIGGMSDVIIFEEDRKDGELKIFKLEYAEEWYKFFGSPVVSQKYEFHIPKGSVTHGFELK